MGLLLLGLLLCGAYFRLYGVFIVLLGKLSLDIVAPLLCARGAPVAMLYALKVCNIDCSDDRIAHRDDNSVACYTLHGISATVDV